MALDTMTLAQIEVLFAGPKSMATALQAYRERFGWTSDAVRGAIFFEAI